MRALELYIQSYEGYFWQYEDGGKVIAVPGGNTIGYSNMILSEIVTYLAPQGLPRFGSLLIALTATNPHGSQRLDSIFSLLFNAEEKNTEVKEALAFAKLLSELPVEYKKGKLRIELLRTLFYRSHNSIGIENSLNILDELKHDLEINAYSNVLRKAPLPETMKYRDIKTLALIGRELNTLELIINKIGNLPEVASKIKEIDFTPDKEGDSYNLIDNLIDDKRSFFVGALVSRLISSLNIPFHSTLPSQQPLGGVADITNKGSFDKLLVSEFAFDDEILLSRLANSEALYHHREVPPSDNKYHRIIIIDTTLKNWGTIHILSFASMLAIANHPKNENPYRVFLVGKSYQEINVNTKADIINGLQMLDTSLDPGTGLLHLFADEQIERSEIFFIANSESLTQPSMLLFNSEYGKRIDHWIHPTLEGSISVYKNPKRGKRFIQEFTLPLDSAWKKHKNSFPQKEQLDDLYDYPILFPAMKIRNIWQDEHFIYTVTKERSLLRYYGNINNQKHCGWVMIMRSFSPDHILRAVMTHDDHSVTILVTNLNKGSLIIESKSGSYTQVDDKFSIPKSIKYTCQGDSFYAKGYGHSYRIQLDGTVTKEIAESATKESNHGNFISKQIYKNIKTIDIVSDKQLRIGKHFLRLTNQRLSLNSTNNKMVGTRIQAESLDNGVFKFPDGSRVIHNRNGMLILISINSEIPNIYIPCILNSSLGVATEESFAGEPYFKMDQRHELHIIDDDFAKMNAIRLTKEILNLDLHEANRMISEKTIVFNRGGNLFSLKEELEKINISSSYRRFGIQQESLKMDDFYNMYIQAFIDQILSQYEA